jgi:hypothetical protein
MSSTGVFHLIEVAGDRELSSDRVARVARVTSVTASCLKCNHHFTAADESTLLAVPGGIAMRCPGCKARQAISSVVFDDFLRRRE